ncbi:hypothetical protein JCM17823_09630 [Halorubrum gandharaense]
MTDWTAFALATAVLTVLLLAATRRSARTLERLHIDDGRSGGAGDGADTAAEPTPAPGPTISTTALLANVLVSQAVALAALAGVAWWAGVPAHAFGVERGDLAGDVLLIGALAGIGLYLANEAAAGLGKRFGMAAPEQLREAMAPGDARGWALLLGVVLPTIAVFEEALFRGALIGAFALGFGVDPWLLAVLSSVAFGLGHGAQGRLGVLVTATLGLVLAALFVVTGSLILVIVAHYVINALEFVVREGLGWEPWGGD